MSRVNFRAMIGLFLLIVCSCSFATKTYTQLDKLHYRNVWRETALDIDYWLSSVNMIAPLHKKLNEKLLWFAGRVRNKPYAHSGAMGEGLSCQGAYESNRVCHHIQEDPIVRTDAFDCQTLVQAGLALLNAKDKASFGDNIVRIDYGGVQSSPRSLAYFNRNHFASLEFNPVNEREGFLENLHRTNALVLKHSKVTAATINLKEWFKAQKRQSRIEKIVRVFSPVVANQMIHRMLMYYPPKIPFILRPHHVAFRYIPKRSVVNCEGGICHANQSLLRRLPVPAVVEIVRDDSKWRAGKQLVKDIIHSGILVSHMGFLYRQYFVKDAVIYRAIDCKGEHGHKQCTVHPVKCTHRVCQKLMFLQASDAYPNNYYYYQQDGHYQCTASKPKFMDSVTTCNRVYALPLADYLSQRQGGRYTLLENDSILGIHIEKMR